MSTDHGTGFERPSGAAAAEAGSGRSAAPDKGAGGRAAALAATGAGREPAAAGDAPMGR